MTDRQESRAKGEATRKANAEAKAARYEQERQDKALVAQAMRGILGDDGATARERIFAALTLSDITGNLIPWRAARLYDSDADTAAFARAVNAIAGVKEQAEADNQVFKMKT